MLPHVNSFKAFDSFAPWILFLPMGGSWRVQAANMRSFVDSAITCMRSAIHLTSPSALSRISFELSRSDEVTRPHQSRDDHGHVDVALTDLQREFHRG
jgi:hypothetical protein